MDPITGTMPEARHRTTKKVPDTSSSPIPRTQAVLVPEAEAPKADLPKPKAKAKGKAGAMLVSWWPVAVGIFLCGFVSEWHGIAVQLGVWAERFFFPLVLLAQQREIGISDQMATVAPQLALYLQLPLEGLYVKLSLSRGYGLKSAIVQITMIHALCAFVLWLLTYLHP